VPRATATNRTVAERGQRGGGGWVVMLIVVLVVAGLLAGLGIWLLHRVGNLTIFSSSGCTATSSTGSVGLDLSQAGNASTIAAVGIKLGVPVYGVEIAVATALQESKLHNLSSGDRDSVGLFQQRPSQGWGTTQEILDPVYASTRFFEALESVPGWQSMQLTDAAQAVQKSGYPDAYAQHEADAKVIATVFSGASDAGLACTLDGPTFSPDAKASAALLTPRGQTLVNTMRYQFGSGNVGSIGGIQKDGAAFSVSAPAGMSSAEATQRAWAYANWATAQAETLGVSDVSFDGRAWSASESTSSWQPTADTSKSAVQIAVVTG
jgi:hypothetical protein